MHSLICKKCSIHKIIKCQGIKEMKIFQQEIPPLHQKRAQNNIPPKQNRI